MRLEFTRVDEALVRRAADLLSRLQERGFTVVTAESCTGGLIASLLSEAPGASECLQGGFVVYTAQNKEAALGVPHGMLEAKGAVSAEVAQAMAEGALARSPADLSVSVTGVAGPEPDERGNPVGLMFFGCSGRGRATKIVRKDFGKQDRGTLRYKAAETAFELLAEAADET
jgi:nicotinamide-nucleotide amidase